VQSLGELIREHKPVAAPSVYDGMSALLVQEAGFSAAYMGSWAATAAKYGLPDLGYMQLSDMVDQVSRIRDIVDIPLVVDAEGGWGNPLQVARSVRSLERAGANAVHLEDHEFGKHLGASRSLPTAVAVDKIKAAVDSRESEDFMIIARSDALASEGLDATIDRLLAYQDAGADALFMSQLKLENSTAERLVEEATVPLVVVNDSRYTTAEHGSRGAALVLYYGVPNYAALKAMREVLASLKADQPPEAGGLQVDVVEHDRIVGIEDHREMARKYGLIK